MRDKQIIDRYLKGESPYTIAPDFNITSRQVQRIIKKNGASRTGKEAFQLAIKEGRMIYRKSSPELLAKRKDISDKLRFAVFTRDRRTCVICGATADDGVKIEIDHIDGIATNNTLENLQTLCNRCNQGKSLYGIYGQKGINE